MEKRIAGVRTHERPQRRRAQPQQPMLLPRQQLAEPVVTMAASTPYKKATAELDEAAKARLRGPFFGGGTPSGHEDVDDGLVELVDEFYNGYGEDGAVGAKEATAPRPPAAWNDTLRAALADAAADSTAAKICAEAELAVLDAGSNVAGGAGEMMKRVADHLRAKGFDAGVCRSSWERSGSVPGGSHEYVDVVVPLPAPARSTTSRYIVEVSIAAKFAIARPSPDYQQTLLSLPPVLVARPEALKAVAAAMCAAAEASIRGAGMHVPPWRRARYVQAKWSGQYKRAAAVEPPMPSTVHDTKVEDPAAVSPPVLHPTGGEGESTAPAARRRSAPSGGRKHCAMEMRRRELGMVRGGLVSMVFRGL